MRMGAAHDCDSFSPCESVPPRPLRCRPVALLPIPGSALRCAVLRREAPLELQLCGTASVRAVLLSFHRCSSHIKLRAGRTCVRQEEAQGG